MGLVSKKEWIFLGNFDISLLKLFYLVEEFSYKRMINRSWSSFLFAQVTTFERNVY